MNDQLDRIEGKIDKLDEAIHGNGNPGLKVEVELLKAHVKQTKWVAHVTLSASICTIIAIVIKWILFQ